MGQTSANRDEPTMEDILSSIRRIIQTNEEQAAQPDTPENDVSRTGFDVDVNAKGHPSAFPEPPEHRSSDPNTFESASDHGDLPANEPYDQTDGYSQKADLETQPAEALNESLGAMGATLDGELVDTPARDTHTGIHNSTSNSQIPTIEESLRDDGSRSLAVDIGISEQQTQSSAIEPETSAGGYDQSETSILPVNGASSANAALISADSSARIASSFADLSNALAAQSATNLEEITHDIVRPLVKEWLDNNLPSMVERMVRDEIERIARGG